MYFVPLYVVTLALAAGLSGIAGRMLLADMGLAPTFAAGAAAALVVAALFAAAQLAYLALLQLLYPWRGGAPYVTESLSNLAALVLVPVLAGLQVPLPHAALREVELFLWLGVFAGLHAAFKLLTLFAVTQSPPATRWRALVFAAGCAGTVMAGWMAFGLWREALARPRVAAAVEMGRARAGEMEAMAHRLEEGAVWQVEIPAFTAERDVVLRLAEPRNGAQILGLAYVNVHAAEEPTPVLSTSVALEEGAWRPLRIPGAMIPAGTSSLGVQWRSAPEPAWVAKIGLRPAVMSDRTLLVSGPWLHRASEGAERTPSVVVLAVDALGWFRCGSGGHVRSTTPRLDAFAAGALRYERAFAPAPEAAASAMSLLSGLRPLRHGHLGARQGPLPEAAKTLPQLFQGAGYATVAFSEGAAPGRPDLLASSDFSRGFELFDDTYRVSYGAAETRPGRPAPAQPAGSQVTLGKAAAWLEAETGPAFAFIRLRELESPQPLARYKAPFSGKSRRPLPGDVYDDALAYVDQQIGAFLDRLDNNGLLESTFVAIVGLYGPDFAGGDQEGGATLSEQSLRVPMWLRIPGEAGGRRTALVGIEDLGPTLLGLAGLHFPAAVDGVDLRRTTGSPERIAVQGDPMILSLRTETHRFIWQSGLRPFSFEAAGSPQVLALYEMTGTAGDIRPRDVAARYPAVVQELTSVLNQYLGSLIGNGQWDFRSLQRQ